MKQLRVLAVMTKWTLLWQSISRFWYVSTFSVCKISRRLFSPWIFGIKSSQFLTIHLFILIHLFTLSLHSFFIPSWHKVEAEPQPTLPTQLQSIPVHRHNNILTNLLYARHKVSPWQKVEAEPYQIKLLDLKWHYMTPCDTCIELYEFHYTVALGTSIALVLTLLLYFLFLFCPDRGVKVEKYGPDKLHKMLRIGSIYCAQLWCQIVPTQESPWIFVGVYRWHARSNSQCEVRWVSQQRGKKRDTFRTNTGTLTKVIHAVCAMLTLEREAHNSQIFPVCHFGELYTPQQKVGLAFLSPIARESAI